MNKKPIGPTLHGLIDYGFAALEFAAPTLFNLQGVARTVCYGFGANTLVTNALTKHSVGLVKVIPLRLHGKAEVPILPVLLLVPWLTGAMKQPNARRYFLAFFVMATTNLLLTDYDAPEAQ